VTIRSLDNMTPDAIAAWLRQCPVHRPLCSDPKPMTRARILLLAARPDGFEVSPRYRDDSLRSAVLRMRKLGLVTLRRAKGLRTIAYATDAARPVLDALRAMVAVEQAAKEGEP
jgi:hypothetical protein